MRTNKWRLLVVALVGALALVFAGCGDDGDDGDAREARAEDEDRTDTTDDETDTTDDEEEEEEDENGGGLDPDLRDRLEEESQDREEAEESGADDEFLSDEYEDYVTITDDEGAVEVDVPEEWSDVDDTISLLNPNTQTGFGTGVSASPDLAAYNATWGTPGVYVLASSTLVDALPDVVNIQAVYSVAANDCTAGPDEPYDDGVYTGITRTYTQCGGTESEYVIIAAKPDDQSFTILVGFQLVTEADIEALDTVISTFLADADLLPS